MKYNNTITLKDGRECILRAATADDARGFQEYFLISHNETDFLATYPDEFRETLEETAANLQKKYESDTDIEICAFVDDRLIGSAGVWRIHDREKMRHRADFGISIMKEYWGLGIGKALTLACIEVAGEAGFLQLELEAVADNEQALALYKKCGYIEYGRNPRGFKNRQGNWQELVSMRLELD